MGPTLAQEPNTDSFAPSPLAGAWLIHVVLILLGIVLLDIIPGVTQDQTWTIVNLGYLTVSARGAPLPLHAWLRAD